MVEPRTVSLNFGFFFRFPCINCRLAAKKRLAAAAWFFEPGALVSAWRYLC